LDLGCGYGLVSSFLTQQHENNKFSQLKSIHIDACDSSPLAVDLTTANLKNSTNRNMTYKVICSDLLTDKHFTDKTYNTIIINPPFSAGKITVKNFITTAYDHLEEGGKLWIVIPTNKVAKGYVSLCKENYGKQNTQIVALEA
jgi:16S rRNA (guanine1207-N2)-methyltransferase